MSETPFPDIGQLKHLTAKLQKNPDFIAWVLAAYKQKERMDDDQLISQLETTPEMLVRLALCKCPNTNSEKFSSQVREIASYTKIDPIILANIIRQVISIDAFSKLPRRNKELNESSRKLISGLLAAARDTTENEEENGDTNNDSTDLKGEVMWLDNESQEVIETFWRLVGEKEAFPRILERSISLALPVALIKLPHLDLRLIESWLFSRRVQYSFDCDNRTVRGCLVAFGGKGIVFVDGTDTSSELRFSIAHEIAHFLIDYWQLRNKASAKYGASILEVFDGFREPSIDERVYSIVTGTQMGLYTDLMERKQLGDSINTWHVENRADKVALALLAPPEAVFKGIDISGRTFSERWDEIVSVLKSHFGLPDYIALDYGADLLKSIGKGPSWSEGLRLTI